MNEVLSYSELINSNQILPFNKILKEKSKLSHWIELIAEESSEHQI